MSLLFFVARSWGRGRMRVSLAVGIMLGVTMGFVGVAMTVTFMHALMQGLRFFPAMLGAGGTKRDQSG